MKTPFTKNSWLTLILIGFSLTLCAKPIWPFSVVVAIEKKTADFYQQKYAKDIKLIINEQLATVDANFNKSASFNGTYHFRADSIYVFDGSVASEVFRPHPRYNYALIINGFSDGAVSGGWYGSYQTMYHAWKWDESGGPFAQSATDALTSVFAYARGAVNLSGMRVEGAKNPVSRESFEPVNSLMTYPYNNIVWDEYTTNLLNSTGPNPIVGDQWIAAPFPRAIGVNVVDAHGTPLENVSITVYPVEWSSLAVSSASIGGGSTNANGVYTFPANPYKPDTRGYPWNMRYCNFLIKAVYKSLTLYTWMPLYDVQNAYFRQGANSTYNATIVVPAVIPTIRLTSVSGNRFVPGDKVTVFFETTGSFDSANQFVLFEVDKNNNAFEIGRVSGTGSSTITGRIGTTGSGGDQYRLRIVSSKPEIKSEDYPIAVSTLGIRQPLYNCQTGAITFRVEGGDSTAITFSAPGITRTRPTDFSGVVEPELRRDPKIIPITATQSGFSVTYNFNFKAYCEFAPSPIVLTKPGISDFTLDVNQLVNLKMVLPFLDSTKTNNPDYPSYYPTFIIHFDGLPSNLYGGTTFAGRSIPYVYIMGIPRTVGTYRVTVTGSTAALPNQRVTTSFTLSIVDHSPYTQFTLEQPIYNCQTGGITLQTMYGDGTPITYTAPGVTRASPTDNVGIVEQELRNDPKPILIEATQSGHKATYLFDFNAYCGGIPALQLLAPAYDCQSGAIQFKTAGGDGSSIEYMAIGITAWTTNPDQFVDKESRTIGDVQPFTLMARQNGRVVTYSWNLKSACGRARMGAGEEPATGLTLTALGNPVQEQLRVLVRGLTEPSVQLRLSDLQGKLIESRRVTLVQAEEVQVFNLNRHQSEIFILQATTDTQTQSIRIVSH